MAVATGPGPLRPADGISEPGTIVERSRHDDDALSTLASRSLVDRGDIPGHMVPPEAKFGSR